MEAHQHTVLHIHTRRNGIYLGGALRIARERITVFCKRRLPTFDFTTGLNKPIELRNES